ncbi:hypothetical protein [Vibrio alginolyticus]|uniref:hypothetical protein n=1 Tax=Vibrio alginolyticus TaxID=663 RepID=UPI0021D0E5FF
MAWLQENQDWVFSGIGVSVILFILSWFKRSSGSKQVQKSGSNSKNYQSARDINIGDK